MKAKVLQFGKAISAALFVLLLSVAGLKNALAQNQVATLQHGDSISVFYGTNALIAAYNAADTCDIITLSDGTFTGVNITKAITLRGAGCVWDSISASFPTIVSGNMSLNVVSEENSLTIEGIHFTGELKYQNLYYPRFFKCNFDYWGSNSSNNTSTMDYAQFVNCILNQVYFYDSKVSNTTLVNCVVWQSSITGSVNAYNSIVRLSSSAGKMNAYNCIISQRQGSFIMNGNSVAYNCIGIPTTVFQGQNFGCMTVNSYADVFETFDGSEFSYLEKFLLKDEIASSFLGTDGTQVGIYGGTAPYNPRPGHMVVKHCNVANKSTVDGKLSVDIEVYTENE